MAAFFYPRHRGKFFNLTQMKTGPSSILLIASALLLNNACQQESNNQFPELDLMSYGMPIVIRAPEHPEIKTMDLVLTQDLTITKGDDFHIQIFESPADIRDVGEIKKRMLEEVRGNSYFHSVLKEDAAGFIYDTKVDSHYVNYGFRYVRIQGDKEFIFQQGLQGKFTKEAVESMYQAVQ